MRPGLIGFVSSEEKSGEDAIVTAIQAVLDAPEPTEEKVRKAVRELGYRITALTFSPNSGDMGEIRGGRMAQFRFTAVNEKHEIKGGTLL